MSGRDVRDILEIQQQQPPTSSSSLQPPRRSGGPPDPRVKRPDGITRELYALIGDNAPSLALAHTVKPKFKERIKRTGPSVKWQWTAFSNPSRGIAKAGEEGGEKEDKEREASRTLRLHHWVKDLPADHVVGAPDHKFAKFNTSSEPYSYTAAEYEAVPPEADWDKAETDHLFALAHQYDLRFAVMADRWELPSQRSVDDLKARYYSVSRKLIRLRHPVDDAARQAIMSTLQFDKAREIDRKAYLRSLLSRTPAQIAEEDFLYIESRRLEQAYNKITAERADLLKILGGREGIGAHGGVQVGVGGGVKGASHRNEKDAERKRKGQTGWEIEGLNGGGLPDGWAGEGSKRKATPAQDAANCIERHPAPSVSATKALPYPSVSLRSSRIAQPKPTVLSKVLAALSELGISTQLIMPTKANVDKLDALQVSLGQMVELKKAVDRIEGEIRTVQKRKEMLVGGPEEEMEGDAEVKKEEGESRVDRESSIRTKRSASASSSSNKRARRD